ncbi:tetratricopeptide repeat protein [Planomicrobium chinense]|uniref:tetratricopeptide repeat protein n=1 Tax=Planococcus chinensis TaxID=272917 RepID=UPI001CC7BFA6|nr:tetratricopeptide repeat protein [Planococcus chinensis]MBZ5201874.1 tetratricopeptide repeat protein [Planococcus chinensis]
MDAALNKAIQLRGAGKFEESKEILMQLAEEYPDFSLIHYQCAWSLDLLGKEAEAVAYYERAIGMGLAGNELEGALLGLGSTYRTLGAYHKSKEVFLKGIKLFPENKAIQTFYAMTLFNLEEHETAMQLLLECLIETTHDEEIVKYKNAIRFYSDKLNEVWE